MSILAGRLTSWSVPWLAAKFDTASIFGTSMGGRVTCTKDIWTYKRTHALNFLHIFSISDISLHRIYHTLKNHRVAVDCLHLNPCIDP